jgi:hypothetical protein
LTDCSGPCIVCRGSKGCLAGHGDDDFSPFSGEELQSMIKSSFHIGWKRNLSSDEIAEIIAYLNKE